MSQAASCFVCGRPPYDPGKRERPWARGVADGRLVLVCPQCQARTDDWKERLDRCPRCDGTRLSLTLGRVVCRGCGHVA